MKPLDKDSWFHAVCHHIRISYTCVAETFSLWGNGHFVTNNNNDYISVEFVSEQVNVLRDKDNQIIEGDENYIQTITDVWTFEKSLNAKTLNWVLVSTKK